MSKSGDDARIFWDKLGKHAGAPAAVDDKDVRGLKNAYISHVRDLAVMDSLASETEGELLLDFGCGTASLLSNLSRLRPATQCIGVDFSMEMLRNAVATDSSVRGRIAHFDGDRLPFVDAAFSVVVTAVVLVYQLTESQMLLVLRELHRVLKPGGRLVAVEQIRKQDKLDSRHNKMQRNPHAMTSLFLQAGFSMVEWRQVRRGHFPLIYLVRYGLLPRSWHHRIARLERWLWQHAHSPTIDYADAVFVLEKK